MNFRTTRRLAATTIAGAALLAIAGFTALGSIFEYPQILEEPVAEILVKYRASDTAIPAWFLVLVISAALLAPAGLLLGRLVGGRRGTRPRTPSSSCISGSAPSSGRRSGTPSPPPSPSWWPPLWLLP